MTRRTGIFSGTFDPVHPGHIAFALEALRTCKLDEVVFFPEPRPRAKRHVTDVTHRLALLETTLVNTPCLRASRLTAEQFTVDDTLPEMRRLFDGELTLLIGSDVVRTSLHRWDGLPELLRTASLAIGLRAGDDQSEVTAIIEQLEREYDMPITYTCITTPEADMTSSAVRSGSISPIRLKPEMRAYLERHAHLPDVR